MTTENTVDWQAAYRYLEHELESVLARVADRMEQIEGGNGSGGGARLRAVTLHQKDSGDLESVIIADGSNLTYSFAVYRDEVLVREQNSGPSNTIVWPPAKAGTYRVQGTVRSAGERGSSSHVSGDLTVTVSSR